MLLPFEAPLQVHWIDLAFAILSTQFTSAHAPAIFGAHTSIGRTLTVPIAAFVPCILLAHTGCWAVVQPKHATTLELTLTMRTHALFGMWIAYTFIVGA